tara:strand:+ start:179 stop:556 length:378 start_codon:yes stop_codon:yes gene_type:complete
MGAYSPFDNAELTFQVYGSFSLDPSTGNAVQNFLPESYTCNIQLEGAFEEQNQGVNKVTTSCSGKLLSPAIFSDKISIGMEAAATINGVQGTVRVLDLGTNILPFARKTQFQSFSGVFEQLGKAG